MKRILSFLAVAVQVVAADAQLHGSGIGFLQRMSVFDLSSHAYPGVQNASLHWHDQEIDHFSWAPTPTGRRTFKQRYFVYRGHWLQGGPIFFYCGNEANVELYVNATGFMWENAGSFGAALVFAEHRYYGKSQPFGKDSTRHLGYLSAEQALADYASLIADLKLSWGSESSPVVAFGGSYGGMLSAWLRMKYPGVVDGAIAASAPVLAFHGVGEQSRDGFADGERYWQVVTRDATEAGGSDRLCAWNVRRTWSWLFAFGITEGGRRELESSFRLCGSPLQDESDVERLALMQLNAWDTMAMGNFPYPSNYLVFQETQDPSVMLPAFPVRAACKAMARNYSEGPELLSAMRRATSVLYNVSGRESCYELPDDPNFDGIWDFQWCTEMLPQETYYTRDGVRDMFWSAPLNVSIIRDRCRQRFRVEPKASWISVEFGGEAGLAAASNIVFSNGLLDPWSSGGVLTNMSDTVLAVVIPEGAHHLDLMFRNPEDPESVREARRFELSAIRTWVDEHARAIARHENAIESSTGSSQGDSAHIMLI